VACLPQPGEAARAKGGGEVALNAICILVAGVIRSTLPTSDFTLGWEHSVEKTRWEERYVAEGPQLRLVQARVQGLGAGMEPAAGARLVGGWWTWRPDIDPLPALRLTHSSFTKDYTFCWRHQCTTLAALAPSAGEGQAVTLEPCVSPRLALTAMPAVGAEQIVNVLTGRGSSPYYPLGVALGETLDKVPGIKTSVQGTKGATENLNRLQQGSGDIAFAPGDALADAWRGNEDAGFKTPLKKLRGIAGLYPDFIQIVARADAGISALSDLKGKRVSVGQRNSSTELSARVIFTAAGLSYASFGKVEYLPFGESVELMKDGKIDATLQSAAPGALALRDLANAVAIVVVPVPPEVVDKTVGSAYIPGVIPANTYRGQTTSVPVVAVRNYLVARDDLDTALVYAVTKALWTGLDRLATTNVAAKAIDRKRALEGMPVPLHPGAEKYYKEAKQIR
jgi:uncharacterized protein